MLFHEVYGCYYNAVAELIAMAVAGRLTEKSMKEVADSRAFSESFLEIIPSLKNGKWQLLRPDLTSPLKNAPTMPPTDLQLRWLKAISMDRRIRLFDVNFDFLLDTEPLFTPSDYIIFDQNKGGDAYDDEKYILTFRTIVGAIRKKNKIVVKYNSSKGRHSTITCDPVRLEYSEKDDKFRAIVRGCHAASVLNISGIDSCEIIGPAQDHSSELAVSSDCHVVCGLVDERKTLERFLLHFAHLKKEVWQEGDSQYRVKLYYDPNDETELLIRILSFGPFVKVLEPEVFVGLVRERLIIQKNCGLK